MLHQSVGTRDACQRIKVIDMFCMMISAFSVGGRRPRTYFQDLASHFLANVAWTPVDGIHCGQQY